MEHTTIIGAIGLFCFFLFKVTAKHIIGNTTGIRKTVAPIIFIGSKNKYNTPSSEKNKTPIKGIRAINSAIITTNLAQNVESLFFSLCFIQK